MNKQEQETKLYHYTCPHCGRGFDDPEEPKGCAVAMCRQCLEQSESLAQQQVQTLTRKLERATAKKYAIARSIRKDWRFARRHGASVFTAIRVCWHGFLWRRKGGEP